MDLSHQLTDSDPVHTNVGEGDTSKGCGHGRPPIGSRPTQDLSNEKVDKGAQKEARGEAPQSEVRCVTGN